MRWRRLLCVGLGFWLLGVVLLQGGHEHGGDEKLPTLKTLCWVCQLSPLTFPTLPDGGVAVEIPPPVFISAELSAKNPSQDFGGYGFVPRAPPY